MGGESEYKLKVGDLLIDIETNNSGILVQKHRVLSTSGRFINDRWYWAWRIRWARNPETKNIAKWTDNFDNTTAESIIVNNIKEGKVKHFTNS